MAFYVMTASFLYPLTELQLEPVGGGAADIPYW